MKKLALLVIVALTISTLLVPVAMATEEKTDMLLIPKFTMVDEDGNKLEPEGREGGVLFDDEGDMTMVSYTVVEESDTGTWVLPEEPILGKYTFGDLPNYIQMSGYALPGFAFEIQVLLDKKILIETAIEDELYVTSVVDHDQQWFPYSEHYPPTFSSEQWFSCGTKAESGDVTMRVKSLGSGSVEDINTDHLYTFAIEDLMAAPDGQLTHTDDNGTVWTVRLQGAEEAAAG